VINHTHTHTHTGAALLLGATHYRGLNGAVKDHSKAAVWFEVAAAGGEDLAVTYIKWCYEHVGGGLVVVVVMRARRRPT
jgi:TPR repeat protein